MQSIKSSNRQFKKKTQNIFQMQQQTRNQNVRMNQMLMPIHLFENLLLFFSLASLLFSSALSLFIYSILCFVFIFLLFLFLFSQHLLLFWCAKAVLMVVGFFLPYHIICSNQLFGHHSSMVFSV